MNERIIFLKERLGFIIDHIELFLEDYNRLTTSYSLSKDIISNHFDFHLISSANPLVWENFKIDSHSFQIASNLTLNLAGLVKNKSYIVPPFIEKERLDNFFKKLTNYLYLLKLDVVKDDKLERIIGEFNSNQINLLFKIDNEEILLSIEEVCKIIINFRDYKTIHNLISIGKYSSKIDLEVRILEMIIKENIKICV